MILFAMLSTASAADIHVTTTIQDAVNIASSNDTIIIPAGISLPIGTISISKNLTLRGSGCGTTTVIGNDINVFTISGGASVTLREMTVTTEELSRGVLLKDSSLALDSVCLEDLGNPTIEGGGIYALRSQIISQNSYFAFNEAETGGAVALSDSYAQFSLTTFLANRAGDNGGAVWTQNSSQYEDIAGLYINNEAFRGGGIYADGTPVYLSDTFLMSRDALR